MKLDNDSNTDLQVIDGDRFREMLYSGLTRLEKQKSLVDSLNVFPVPDGDTGTNMFLTLKEAVQSVEKEDSNRVDDIAETMSRGALMGARGNSGVILSQLLRGFSQSSAGKKLLEPEDLVEALEKASKVAYNGVLKPVEGTILTVSRRAAEGARKAFEKKGADKADFLFILQQTLKTADRALQKTPEQLPVLKEAEVVDAGGQGYIFILEGMYKALKGEGYVEESTDSVTLEEKVGQREFVSDIKYAYCTQMLIHLNENNEKQEITQVREELNNYGDSLMVVGSGDVIKVHIHTNHPGVILEHGLKIGMIDDIKIDNMKSQHQEMEQQKRETNNLAVAQGSSMVFDEGQEELEEDSEPLKRTIVAVAAGEGIKQILSELGVKGIIHGGQSMNPSTNDFLEKIKSLPAKEIIVFPNNKNIISAALQAAEMVDDKKIEVVPTKSFTEAIACLLLYNEDEDLEELVAAMKEEKEYVRTAEITRAVKDSKVKGLEIKEGDVIGLFDGDIKVKGSDYNRVVLKLFEKSLAEEELITIYYGEEISEKQAINLRNKILDRFASIDEVEIYAGEQPLYPYIISLE